jgi:hypothetical protein
VGVGPNYVKETEKGIKMGRLDLNELKEEYQKEWGFSEEDSNYMIQYIRKLCNEYGAKTVMEEDSDVVFKTIKRDIVKHLEYVGRYKNDILICDYLEIFRRNHKVCRTSFQFVIFVFLFIHCKFDFTDKL